MDIKGLSRYDFSFDAEGALVVVNKRTGKRLKETNGTLGEKKYLLYDDTGCRGSYHQNKLKWLMKHTGVTAPGPDQRSLRVTFDDDGNAVSFAGMSKRYTSFRSIDDAMETLILIDRYRNGDTVPLVQFVQQSKKIAITTVCPLVHVGRSTCEAVWDDAVERFYNELDTFNVTRIMPLFAWLCKCLKGMILRTRGKRRVAEVDQLTDAQR